MADQWNNQGYGGYQQGAYNPQQQQQQQQPQQPLAQVGASRR